MPNDTGDKTEAPTPRRIQDARSKGQVAKSADLPAALGLLAGILLLHFYGSSVINGFLNLTQKALAMQHPATDGTLLVDQGWRLLITNAAVILVPFFIVLILVAIAANVLQVGFLFTAQTITPKFDKISPLQGFKRLFSKRTAIRMLMNFGKVGLITLIAWFTVKSFMPQLVCLAGLDYVQTVSKAANLIFILGLRLSGALVILAFFDFVFQKYQMTQDLRMTKEEVREEMKRMEGDPTMRQRRRNVARQLAAQRMSQAVPKADVVITNPTHLAVALQYQHDSMHAPKVVAKGAGFIAQRIREIAIENNVPIIERKPLARALYKACDVGDFVPPELYKAVAEVLAYVFELAGKGIRTYAAG